MTFDLTFVTFLKFGMTPEGRPDNVGCERVPVSLLLSILFVAFNYTSERGQAARDWMQSLRAIMPRGCRARVIFDSISTATMKGAKVELDNREAFGRECHKAVLEICAATGCTLGTMTDFATFETCRSWFEKWRVVPGASNIPPT